MSLKQQLNDDFVAAMKAKDDAAVRTLRLVKTALAQFEVSGSQKKEASDEEVQALIAKEAKRRKEAIEAYEKGGRPKQAAAERDELAVLEKYLPTQLSEEELNNVVQEAISAVGASSLQDFGKVMGAVMARVKGCASGGAVSATVKRLLG